MSQSTRRIHTFSRPSNTENAYPTLEINPKYHEAFLRKIEEQRLTLPPHGTAEIIYLHDEVTDGQHKLAPRIAVVNASGWVRNLTYNKCRQEVYDRAVSIWRSCKTNSKANPNHDPKNEIYVEEEGDTGNFEYIHPHVEYETLDPISLGPDRRSRSKPFHAQNREQDTQRSSLEQYRRPSVEVEDSQVPQADDSYWEYIQSSKMNSAY